MGWQQQNAGDDTGMLWVAFRDKNNTTGYYPDIPRQTFELFRDSDSKGKFINSQLKGAAFVKATLPGTDQ